MWPNVTATQPLDQRLVKKDQTLLKYLNSWCGRNARSGFWVSVLELDLSRFIKKYFWLIAALANAMEVLLHRLVIRKLTHLVSQLPIMISFKMSSLNQFWKMGFLSLRVANEGAPVKAIRTHWLIMVGPVNSRLFFFVSALGSLQRTQKVTNGPKERPFC